LIAGTRIDLDHERPDAAAKMASVMLAAAPESESLERNSCSGYWLRTRTMGERGLGVWLRHRSKLD
jgi:hypothetical protein